MEILGFVSTAVLLALFKDVTHALNASLTE